MVTAVFTDNDDYARAYGLWQWDYGQQLRIEGLHLPTAVEIHFALQETGGEAITRVGTTKDGVTTVTIPDSMLEGNSTAWTADKAYNIYAWVYLSDKLSGETIKRITMQVKSRPKPEAFETPEDGEIFREAIEAVNDAAKRAEEAGDKAVSAADEAKAAATQTAEHLEAVQGLAEQVETNADTVAQDKQAVAGMLSQTQQAASDAALSAQAAKLSETAAVQAQTGAEAAEDGARQYAEETGEDRQAVANDKQTVTQMREDVAADRQAVEQIALQFGQTAQDALTAIGQAQSTAVGAVEAEGQKQTTAVQEAGTQAVSEVTEAKTEAVQSVTAEGDKQTKRVEDAAAGIVADREQIAANKAGIEALSQKKADAIIETAQGDTMTLTDSSDKLFEGLRVFGKSTQVKTTGAQLLDESKVKQNNFRAFEYINLPVGEGTFTLSSNIPKSSTDSSAYIMLISGNVQEISSENTAATNGVYKGQSRTFPSINGYVTIAYRNDADANNIINFNGYWYMLNKGAEEKPYEPYTGGKPSPSPEYKQEPEDAGKDGSIEVKVGGRNLFDGKFESGSIRQDNGENQDYADRIRTAGFIQIKPSTVYSIKLLETISFSVRWYDKDKKFIKSEATNTISQSPDNARYMRFLLLTTKLDTKCMVYAGSAPTPYEPYRAPQTLTLQTPNGLPGVPVSKDGNYTDADGQQWVCDEIDLGRGKYVQRVNNFVFNDKALFSVDIEAKHENSILINISVTDASNLNTLGANSMLCDRLKACEWNIYSIDEVSCGYTGGANYLRVRLPISAGTEIEEIKNYLADKSFKILYIIATPIERDLTPEEIAAYKALRTYIPTTVITNDAGAGMEVTYVADTRKYIQNLEERLNAKMVNIQSALISQKTSGGGHLTIADSSPLPVEEFSMTGKTEQMKTTGKNLLKPNDYNVYHELPLKAGTVVTLMTNGQLSEGGNIKFIGMENENVWFGINKGQTRVCHSIGNKDVKGFYNLLTKKEGLEYMLAIGDVKIFEPYSGSFPSPSPDWEQPIEITDQPVTITVKGGTEQQSIILTPPRPFTKWDKLEKVNGVWCWVYQHKVLSGTEMAKNLSGIHTSGALMVNVSGLGIAESQDNSVCNKLICPTKSVASLAYGEFRILYGTIYLKIDGVTTVEDGRQWLESNDIIIIAQASAPEYIPLTPSEQAQLNTLTMYAGTTEITNNGGCTMGLTYTADTKTYIDNKLAAISAAMIGGT